MKQKTLLKILVGMILLISLFPLSTAQDEIVIQAGVTPDQPFRYFFDNAYEDVRYTLTIGDENKVNYGLMVAEEKVAEVREMMEKENVSSERIRESEQRRERFMNRINERAKGNSTLQNRIQERLQVHTNKLKEIRANAPEEAKEGMDKAYRNSRIDIKNKADIPTKQLF